MLHDTSCVRRFFRTSLTYYRGYSYWADTHYGISDIQVNITAERALLRLREKLQGTEQGQSRSIEHQVGTLIQQAIDPENLCKLFCGWQAFL